MKISAEIRHRRNARYAAQQQGFKLTKSRTADAYWIVREISNGAALTREVVAGGPDGMSFTEAERLIRSGALAADHDVRVA